VKFQCHVIRKGKKGIRTVWHTVQYSIIYMEGAKNSCCFAGWGLLYCTVRHNFCGDVQVSIKSPVF